MSSNQWDLVLGNDLVRLVDTFKVARRTRGIIWQNCAGTIVVDLAGIILASVGLLNPLLAAFIHVVSELTFIVNSARLLPQRAKANEWHSATAPHPQSKLVGAQL